jgi:hypothetical protein
MNTYKNLNILYMSVRARSTVFATLITGVNNNDFCFLQSKSTFV